MIETIISKRCSKCKQIKFFSDFSEDRRKRDGLQSCCKNCHNATQKIYRQTETGSEYYRLYKRTYQQTKNGKDVNHRADHKYRRQHPEKCKARDAVKYAIKCGRLAPPTNLKCQHCGVQAQQYHHPSYKKEHWLDVIPLCKPCHRKTHRCSNPCGTPE
jgi:hypothetical protein